jgi:hypothetical protein
MSLNSIGAWPSVAAWPGCAVARAWRRAAGLHVFALPDARTADGQRPRSIVRFRRGRVHVDSRLALLFGSGLEPRAASLRLGGRGTLVLIGS